MIQAICLPRCASLFSMTVVGTAHIFCGTLSHQEIIDVIGNAHNDTWKKKKAPPRYNTYKSVDAFRLATLGGTETVDMDYLIGSTEVGKRVDLGVFDSLSSDLAENLDSF